MSVIWTDYLADIHIDQSSLDLVQYSKSIGKPCFRHNPFSVPRVVISVSASEIDNRFYLSLYSLVGFSSEN